MDRTTPTSTSLVAETSPPAAPAEQQPSNSDKPHLIIRPKSGWQSLDLQQIWLFRDLLATLAARDVKLRYRQTALGALWVILQPLIAAGIFTFVFDVIAGVGGGFIFSYASLLCWTAFVTTVNKTSSVMVQNANLVSKIYFPRLILPLSTVYSTLIDFGVAALMMVVLMAIARIAPGWAALTMPLWLALSLMLAIGLGLYFSALMVSYRDVQYVVPVLMQFLLYASPVAYSMTAAFKAFAKRLPPEWVPLAEIAFLANPMTGLLEAFRWSLLGGTEPIWGAIIYSSICAITLFVGGAFAFKKMERKFADVI